MRIIFEGISGAGKTAIIKNMTGKNTVEVPEYVGEQDEGEWVFNGRSDDVWMLNEERKVKLSLKYANSKLVLIDRGPLSIVIYGFLKLISSGDNESWRKRLDWYLNGRSGNLIEPDMYIFVDTPLFVCNKRTKLLYGDDDNNLWIERANEALQLYKFYFDFLLKERPYLTVNGANSIESNITTIISFINKNKNENITSKS